MNTLQQSRQKVNIVMLSLDDGLFLLQMRKHLGWYQLYSYLKYVIKYFVGNENSDEDSKEVIGLKIVRCG